MVLIMSGENINIAGKNARITFTLVKACMLQMIKPPTRTKSGMCIKPPTLLLLIAHLPGLSISI